MKRNLILILLLALMWGCATSESTTEEDRDRPFIDFSDELVDEFVLENLDDFERRLLSDRSQLTDQFADLEHDMPEIFLREVVREEIQIDEYAGFRVQILSTRDVVHADTTRDNFQVWADTTFQGIQTDAYVLFRQPYYRVHAGDFRNREMANEFSRLIKSKFPDAWVVHDRIEPNKVPADTATIRIREFEPIEEEADSLQQQY